jgi:acetyl esterase/lipase
MKKMQNENRMKKGHIRKIGVIILAMALLMLGTLAVPIMPVSSEGILQFPVNDYTEQTLAVATSAGQKNVTYHLYRHIAYVANPVDVDYESLDVGVPVNIDGVAVDAMNAPILLVVNNGGYRASSNNATGTSKLLSDTNGKLALASGYVVVVPGLRGWNLISNGTYYGKAPAAIVDLKAVVRYIRYNKGVMPGNTEWIIAAGISGGGAQSTLLGVSGNSHLYDAALEQIGAANATDNIYASAPYCPITDLEHADMAYEWEFGTTPRSGELVNQSISQELKNAFSMYQASLNLQGKNGYGALTAENYGDYLVNTYLIPSANKYLNAQTNENRVTYLSQRTWITWSNNSASFTFADYVAYIGRSKNLPAFDAFDLSAWENSLFGNSTTNARHFANFSLQYASGDPNAEIDGELQTLVNMMNPMYFIQQNNTDCAQYWFIRTGTKDTDTAHIIFGNLATILENRGKDVNASLYWDGVHGVNQDPEAFVAWVSQITGYPIVPEGLTIGVMMLLATGAVIVGTRYFRKKTKTVGNRKGFQISKCQNPPFFYSNDSGRVSFMLS